MTQVYSAGVMNIYLVGLGMLEKMPKLHSVSLKRELQSYIT